MLRLYTYHGCMYEHGHINEWLMFWAPSLNASDKYVLEKMVGVFVASHMWRLRTKGRGNIDIDFNSRQILQGNECIRWLIQLYDLITWPFWFFLECDDSDDLIRWRFHKVWALLGDDLLRCQFYEVLILYPQEIPTIGCLGFDSFMCPMPHHCHMPVVMVLHSVVHTIWSVVEERCPHNRCEEKLHIKDGVACVFSK